jgi:hypothetical protein
MPNTYTLIASNTVGSGGVASVTFSSFAATYTYLKIVVSTRASDSSPPGLLITFNGATTNFSHRYLLGDGASAASGTNAYSIGSASIYAGTSEGTSNTASTFSSHDIYIPNYTGSNYKSVSIDAASENNAATAYAVFSAGLWSNTAAITSVSLSFNSGNFVQYSTFYLYGIKNS